MSRELEQQLVQVPERWRDATRTRAYAVMDYLSAGEDGTLLVEVLSRRTGLSKSAFYTLVRRWRDSGGDAASLAPWARRPDSKPRIPDDATSYIDTRVEPLIAADPDRATEPVAKQILADWPEHLSRPGISYVRRRVNHVRAVHQKKTRRERRDGDGDDDLSGSVPKPRWPLDVIIIDHVAVEAVVWVDGEPTLPITTLVIDAATRRPVGVATVLDEPEPSSVARAIVDLARPAELRGAPGPPTIVLTVTPGSGWPQLVRLLKDAGANVVARPAKRLSFGSEASHLLENRLDGYKLAPRMGHRPRSLRATPRAVLSMPNRELAYFEQQVQALVEAHRDEVAAERNWPPAATPHPDVWASLAAMPIADLPGGEPGR